MDRYWLNEGLAKAKGMKFCDEPIESFTREELIAVIGIVNADCVRVRRDAIAHSEFIRYVLSITNKT